MNKESELPKRRHTRLKKYDYSSAGAYFVTICTKNRKCVFSHIAVREQGHALRTDFLGFRKAKLRTP